MDPLEVDPEKLAASSDAFTTIADTAHRIADGTNGGVSGAGDFAGPGAFGDAFRRLFEPGIGGITDAIHGLGDGMAGTADKLKDSASMYKTSDQVNTESVPRLPAENPINPTPAPDQVKAPRRG
jgi:hypothetical protein